MNSKKLAKQTEFFKALAHPARLQIVMLVSEGEKCVSELNEAIDLDMSVISRHLKQLQDVKILSAERKGKNIFYKLEMACVLGFMECMFGKKDLDVCTCGGN